MGNIINVSSIYGLVGQIIKFIILKKLFHGYKPLEYSVAKSGIIGFTKSLTAFYTDSNIKVNCIVFWGVNNKQNKNLSETILKTILKRMSYVGEYNNYIEFLVRL